MYVNETLLSLLSLNKYTTTNTFNTMTNKEKIARIEKMHKEATEMVAYCQKEIANGETRWTLHHSLQAFKDDAAALKFALKGLRLMQELVNDMNEGGEQ